MTVRIPGILEEHAEDAAFLWMLRDQAALAPDYDRNELAELEERLVAHLDPLLAGGEEARVLVRGQWLDWPEPGESFLAGLVALQAGDLERVNEIVATAQSEDPVDRGFRGALAWLPFEQVSDLLADLVTRPADHECGLGLAGYGAHRMPPPSAMGTAIEEGSARLAARAARTAAQLGLVELLPPIRARAARALEDPDLVYWCAWSARVLGDGAPSLRLLDRLEELDVWRGPACGLLGTAMDPAEAKAWHQRLLQSDSPIPIEDALQAATGMGQVSLIPWILDQMSDSRLGGCAGDAFHRITGADLVDLDLVIEGAGSEDDSGDWRPQDDLPLPDPEGCKVWWDSSPLADVGNQPMMLGVPKTDRSALEGLLDADHTSQRDRYDLAVELASAQPGGILTEVRRRLR